ncbi:thiaminase II [Nocardioides caldifontis]|uniref:thiaminase II n=1 Tax=Nocardioides caldifontis TaxID=2588938 RepID=UPI0011DF0069|nr:thiaminase II [Nocardioides caldifontis]
MTTHQAAPVTGATAKGLRASCPTVWESLHAHPFLREMATGTLSLDRFRFYLEQDTMYLEEYAKVMALGAARAARVDEVAWLRDSMDNIVDNELPRNRELLVRIVEMGAADRGGSRAMAPTTLAYTSFLTTTAYRGDALDVMVAILPCAVSYREIALTLVDQIAPDSLYTAWMEFFVGDFYGRRLSQMQANLDELAARVGEGRTAALREVFATASRLEVAFWDMAYHCRQWPDLAVEVGRG